MSRLTLALCLLALVVIFLMEGTVSLYFSPLTRSANTVVRE